jgi:hypothetical protein
MSKNRAGALRMGNLEWGNKARKQEDDLRGINNRARRQSIAEQVADLDADEVSWATLPGDRYVSWVLA